MSTKLNDLLSDPDKKRSEAKGLLAKLFRQMLFDLKIDSDVMERKMTTWLNDPLNNAGVDPATRSSRRGNLAKAITNDDMTWRSFLRGMVLLRPVSIKLFAVTYWGRKTYVTHELPELRFSKEDIQDAMNDEYYEDEEGKSRLK